MSILLVGKPEYRDHGVFFPGEDGAVERLQNPIPAVPAVRDPGAHDACVTSVRVGETADGGKVAFQVASGDSEPRDQIGMLPDAPVELQRRNDLGPFGTQAFTELGERVGDADGGYEAAIDRDLREFGALVAHRQNRAREGGKKLLQRRRDGG
jgi:hypothetical protein